MLTLQYNEAVGGDGFGVVRFGSMAKDDNGGEKNGAGTPKGGRGTLGDLVKAESMIQVALALPAGCLIGALVGTALDKHFHTGWIVAVGIVLGAVAGFIQIFRTASQYMKRDK
jgi:ATP synthase protein I